MLVAVALAAPWAVVAGPAAQAANGTSCQLTGFVVKDATPIAQGGTSGAGDFGSAQVGPVPVGSRVVCNGTINGSATVGGSFYWCPQSTAGHDTAAPGTVFSCGTDALHQLPATTTGDEAAWPSSVPTNVHVRGIGTLTSDPNAGLKNLVTGESYPSCSFDFNGHALAPVKLDLNVTCGGAVMKGVATATFVPVMGPAGNTFSSQNPHTQCGPSPDCFRAVIFIGNITVAG